MHVRAQRTAVPAEAAHKPTAPAPHSGLPDMEPSQVLRQLLYSGAIQAKLTVSQPGDPLEQEADQVADEVMRMPAASSLSSADPGIQRKCSRDHASEEEEKKIQPKEAPGRTPSVTPRTEAHVESLRGGGQPLPNAVRSFFEPRFGLNFSDVRVHSDSRANEAAAAVQARAFTLGRDVVFGTGQYAPHSTEGQMLLAHELAHVGQQSSSSRELLLRRQGASEDRQDIVVIVGRPSRTISANETEGDKENMEAWRAAAHALSPVVFEGLTVDRAFSGLKNLKKPIRKLYIIGHADENGVAEVSTQGDLSSTSVADLTKRMGTAAGPLGNRRPESVEMLYCFGGATPKTMGRIGDALGASKVRAPEQMTIIRGLNVPIDGKPSTAKDIQKTSDTKLSGSIQKTYALKYYDFVPGVPHPNTPPTDEERMKALIGVLRRTGRIPFVSFNEPIDSKGAVPYWKANIEKRGKNEEPSELKSRNVIEVDLQEPEKKP